MQIFTARIFDEDGLIVENIEVRIRADEPDEDFTGREGEVAIPQRQNVPFEYDEAYLLVLDDGRSYEVLFEGIVFGSHTGTKAQFVVNGLVE